MNFVARRRISDLLCCQAVFVCRMLRVLKFARPCDVVRCGESRYLLGRGGKEGREGGQKGIRKGRGRKGRRGRGREGKGVLLQAEENFLTQLEVNMTLSCPESGPVFKSGVCLFSFFSGFQIRER